MRPLRALFALGLLYLVVSAAAGMVLADSALHGNRRPLSRTAEREIEEVAHRTGTRLVQATLRTADGVDLRAWALLQPAAGRPAALALHGVAGTRGHMIGYGALLADAGYSVVLPDARGHGESGGLASYGVREAGDVAAWTTWLADTAGSRCTVGVGSSMGAAHLLQALPVAPLSAVVADSSYATFRQAALDRLERYSRLGWFGRLLSRPALEAGLLAAWLRDDLWMGDAEPARGLAASRTPVLLIHGAEDRATPVAHAHRLAAARPGTPLWLVPGAGHTGAWNATGSRYAARVLAFLGETPCAPVSPVDGGPRKAAGASH